MMEKHDKMLDFYEKIGFDLVPIIRNGKVPIEKDWTNKTHKEKKEWEIWLERGLNIGVKTGQRSGITVIDIDTKEVPKELQTFLGETLTQETNKGYHLFFKYDKELPKTRLQELKIDIENDGGQVVIAPSSVEGIKRIIEFKEILPIPPEFKKLIKTKSASVPSSTLQKIETLKLDLIAEGSRHNILMHLGGILRKELNFHSTAFVLNLLNSVTCTPPLTTKEISEVINSLNKYIGSDEKELSGKILDYLNIVEEANARDVREALGFKKERIDKALSFLLKEEYLVKKRRMFHIIKKADWQETFMDAGKEIDFVFPYFNDVAQFRYGDMAVIGGKTGTGKTHVAMNIIKRLVAQNMTPHYVTLESGNRFSIIAQGLGLKEGDFKWASHYNPENIELEKNAITIIDWLLPKDYANTDKLFEYFSKQLTKNGGILIAFVQLRGSGEFFAKDMIDFFPSFVCKFLYDNDEDRSTSYFIPTKVREGKVQHWGRKLLTKYDWATKELIEFKQEDSK